MWKDQAQELQKRSPEFMERILSERIHTREDEISRLAKDKGQNEEDLELLRRHKANLETDLSRTRGFRLMLALEEGTEDDGEVGDTEPMASLVSQASEIQVVLLGEVGVDSGQLMITDPCYIDDEWQNDIAVDDGDTVDDDPLSQVETGEANGNGEAVPPYSYKGAMAVTSSAGYGELAYKLGHPGAGVVFHTAWGDGVYPVYGELHDGRIVRAYINVG